MVTQIFKNLFRRKTRTLLTVSGIAVGVAAIVALGAMGEGLRTGYVSMFSGSGADLVMIQKGSYDITMSGVDQEVMTQVADACRKCAPLTASSWATSLRPARHTFSSLATTPRDSASSASS